MRITFPRRLVAILLALPLTIGCTDQLVGPDAAYPESGVRPAKDKFRHPQLLSKAMRPGSVPGKDENALGLIFSIGKQSVMERYAIMERYAVMERYTVMERYEYDEAFAGFAVTIEDTTGGTDFSAFLDSLQADPDIAWFEPDFSVSTPVSSNLSEQSGQQVPWSVAYVGGTTSSTISGDGRGSVDVDVYIIDTGVSNTDLFLHESLDFRDSLGAGVADPFDYDGHGTHVAGIIGAVDNDQGLVGVAPGARIHNLKVLGDDGMTDVSVVIASIEYVIAQRKAYPDRPMVVNMSLGENVGTRDYTALDETLNHLVSLGVTVVVAAGNQGVDASLVTPAHVRDVITVGAHDADGYFAPFSNWGDVVDILAPGVDVISLAPTSEGVGAPVLMTGTSMAAPHVAGAAALYLSSFPQAGPSQVREALIRAARPGIRLPVGGTTSLSLWVGDF